VLGYSLDKGELLQIVVPRDTIFGVTINGEYGLCGCVTAPGFHDDGIELIGGDKLGKIEGDSELIELPKYKESRIAYK